MQANKAILYALLSAMLLCASMPANAQSLQFPKTGGVALTYPPPPACVQPVDPNVNWVWASDCMIQGTVTIPSRVTLIIAPGVIIKFDSGAKLVVEGTLKTSGGGETTYFTSLNDDTVGGDTNGNGSDTSPEPGNWGWIELVGGGKADLHNLVIRYSGEVGTVTHGAILAKNYNGVTVASDVVLNNNVFNGIELPKGSINASTTLHPSFNIAYYIPGDLTIAKVLTVMPGATLKFAEGARLLINGTLNINTPDSPSDDQRVYMTSFNDDSVGGDTNADGVSTGEPGDWGWLEFGDAGSATLSNLTVRFGGYDNKLNRHGALYIPKDRALVPSSGKAGLTIDPTVTLADNLINGIELFQGNTTVKDLALSAYPIPYYLPGDLRVPKGKSLTVAAGAVLKFDTNSRLFVEGTLKATGTITQPIIFTSARDDAVGGDTNGDGSRNAPAVGDWSWIEFDNVNKEASEIFYGKIRYGGVYGTDTHGAIYVKNGTLAITQTTLTRNEIGLEVDQGDVNINDSNIIGNTAFGVKHTNATGRDVDATKNWWGHYTGPRHSGDTSGQGDAVSDGVDFSDYRRTAQSQGNADNNDQVDLCDFEIWRSRNQIADFNSDGNIDAADFAIWKTTFLQFLSLSKNSFSPCGQSSTAAPENISPSLTQVNLPSDTGMIAVDVLVRSEAHRVSGATAVITYSQELLDFVMPQDLTQIVTGCGDRTTLPEIVSVTDDAQTGSIRISTVTITQEDTELPPLGVVCLARLTFALTDKLTADKTASIGLYKEKARWQIVGPTAAFTPHFSLSESSIFVRRSDTKHYSFLPIAGN